MTDRELEQRLRAWYAAQVVETETAPADLRESITAIPASTPMPLRPIARRRNFTLLAVAAVLAVGGALAAGSGLLRFTSVPPAPSDAAELVTPAPAPSVTPVQTANLRPGALVAFIRGDRLWVAGEDGRGVHEVFPGGAGNQWGRLAWSPDGSRLLYSEDGKLFLTDVGGRDPQLLDTGCVTPCKIDTDAAFSSDGSKIVFARQSLDADGQVESTSIATMDLASGRVALLASTALDSSWWPSRSPEPSWSPDGQRIVFSRSGEGDVDALFVVDQDGGNLHQISPPTLAAGFPEWSPDGSRIVFWTSDFTKGPRVKDIYTIRPDGTELRQLTNDGVSSAASWSADGRILFAKKIIDDGGVSFWTMDVDGTDATVLVPVDAAALLYDEFPSVRAARQPLGGPPLAAIARPGAPAIPIGPPPPTPIPPDLAPGFSWTGSSTLAEWGQTATLLGDGRVLITASCDTAAELYDPTTGTFSPTGSLTRVHGGMTATLLHDGRVLFAGGSDCAPSGQEGTWPSAELYDPATGTFSPTGSMAEPREQHTATLLADGRVLIAGGIGGESAPAGGIRLASYRTAAVDAFLATAEIYDPVTGRFTKIDSMSTPHRGHTATLLGDGRVLVVGNGGESSPAGKVADLFDPATGKFVRTGSMKTGRSDHTATLLGDGRVLILGGGTANDSATASGEFYDPTTGTFSPAGRMADGRSHHTATRLSDGRVLIVGGSWHDGENSGDLSSAELYDPGTGGFSPIGSIGTPRVGHNATLLQDGRVLIAGGADIRRHGSVGVVSAVLYQP